MFKEYSLEGKTALVTGGGRGLGRAIATVFAEAGADVAVASRTVKDLEETAADVRKSGRRCAIVPADVTSEDSVKSMVQKTLAELGKIDILVNNAGVEFSKPILPLPELKNPAGGEPDPTPHSLKEWQTVMELNVNSVFLVCREVGAHMVSRRQGRIINIASGLGVKPTPYLIAYGVSKAAVAYFSRCLALEWSRYNIHVNAMAPGPLESDLMYRLTAGYDPKILGRYLKDLPMRRLGKTREVALLAVYLASEASDYMTGQVVALDGGGSAN
ncbi:MAG: SDR family oxidoreductase [Chloroflexi bacterium]|nr:SDR family oxidoreductase [Chloroflexota bacterium]